MPVHNIRLELERAGIYMVDTDVGADGAPDNGWPEAQKGALWFNSTLNKLYLNEGVMGTAVWVAVTSA